MRRGVGLLDMVGTLAALTFMLMLVIIVSQLGPSGNELKFRVDSVRANSAFISAIDAKGIDSIMTLPQPIDGENRSISESVDRYGLDRPNFVPRFASIKFSRYDLANSGAFSKPGATRVAGQPLKPHTLGSQTFDQARSPVWRMQISDAQAISITSDGGGPITYALK